MAKLTVISGVGGKGPACFLVEAAGARLMLDLGYGPMPGAWPDVSGVGKVDALLLSHGHRDHAGALRFLPQLGNPRIFATAAVLARCGCATGNVALPLSGGAEVCGIPVRTGRNGHAPGGIWLHLGIGHGFLYTGDYSVESPIYAFDEPPPAATAVIDASYGDYDASLGDCRERLEAVLDAGAALLPVPADGRGPEIAFDHAQRTGGLPCIGADLRASLERLVTAESDSLRPGAAGILARLAREAPPIAGPRGLMLAGRADAGDGETASLVARWETAAVPRIVFTGYVPAGSPARRLMDAGRARYIRWNVHPRLADNAALARSIRAQTIVPAFGDAAQHQAAWSRALAPARVTAERQVELG